MIRLYEQWMLSEYTPAVREGRGKEITLPGWFFPPSISPLAGSLILSLIHIDPQQRCTAAEALRHPWSTGESLGSVIGTCQVSSETMTTRNQISSTRTLFPEEGLHSSHTVSKGDKEKDREKEKEKEKDKVKPKGQNKDQKEKRSSNISTPQSLSTTVSQGNTPRLNKPKSPPTAPVLTTLQIPTQFPRSESPTENSPTRVALSSVATALVPYSIEDVRGFDIALAVEEILVNESSSVRRIRSQLSDEVRSVTDVATNQSRTDAVTSILVIESSIQQSVTRRTSQNHQHLGPNVPESPSPLISASLPFPLRNHQQGINSVAVISQVSETNRDRNEPLTNQVQQTGNTTALTYSARRDQGRERGYEALSQDREEDDRKERYRSILEQQRQKEAAALAMDSQGEQHVAAAVSTVANREPGRVPGAGSLLAARGANSTTTSMFVYNTQNESSNNVTREVAHSQNQSHRVNTSVETDNTVSWGENNSNHCDKHK